MIGFHSYFAFLKVRVMDCNSIMIYNSNSQMILIQRVGRTHIKGHSLSNFAQELNE